MINIAQIEITKVRKICVLTQPRPIAVMILDGVVCDSVREQANVKTVLLDVSFGSRAKLYIKATA